MKRAFFILLAFCVIQPSLYPAQDRPGVRVFQIPCQLPSHAHRPSDFRIALVRVLDVTGCGFTYEDLEDHSVPAEGISTDLRLFELGSVGLDTKVMTVRLPRGEVKKNAFGVLLYCVHCRAGLLVETTVVGVEKHLH